MLRRYTVEQAAEKISLDATELRFLIHHFREFLSDPTSGNPSRQLTDQDLVLLVRAYRLIQTDGSDPADIRHFFRNELNEQRMSGRRQAEILAFVSGRPGAGKSSLILNLATALVARGSSCTIFDGSSDAGGIWSIMKGHSPLQFEDWNAVLDSGVRLIYGEGLLEAENRLGSDVLESQLDEVDASSDFILVDTGRGRSDNALRYAMLVDETIGVTTADVGANADCFSVVRMLKDVDPDLRVSLVLNRTGGLADARESFARINGAAQKVSIDDLPALGWVAEDEALRKCMADGEAVVEKLPTTISARGITRLADHLTNRLTPVEHRSSAGLSKLVQALRSAMERGSQSTQTF